MPLPAGCIHDPQCPAEASSPPLVRVSSVHTATSPLPSATLRDTGPLTDTPLPPQLVVGSVLFLIFYIFFGFKNQFESEPFFFLSVASSLCSHPVAKPYSLNGQH